MARPPTIRVLMEDPVYREYMRTPPDPYTVYAGTAMANPSLTTGEPWRVWIELADDRWKTGTFARYADAFNLMARAVKSSSALDVAIVSRRVFFPPPGVWEEYKVRVTNPRTKEKRIEVRERWVQTFHWDYSFAWCSRCRRPTQFRQLHWTHHALRQQPCLTDDDPYRCVYCGIRRVALPDLNTLVR